MSESCPNCGKPVLPSDTVCWHCGYTLPKRPKSAPPANSGQPAERRVELHLPARSSPMTEAPPVAYDFRALFIYGLLTLLVVLGLWLVMRSLSRQPILVRSAAFSLGGDWVAVTDVDLTFTLSLPTDWQWLDVGFRDQSDLLERVRDRQPYIDRALRPLGSAADDVDILAVAVDTQALEEALPQPLVVVGRSTRLAELTPDEALALLAEQPLPISGQDIDTRLTGQPQARFTVLDQPRAYQCRHLFVPNQAGHAYLMAACAPQPRFGAVERDLDEILDSFQLLER